jgi:Rad3-related DNA helicase
MSLQMWVIYFDSTDHPHKYTVRRWLIERGEMKPSNDYALAPTLEMARAHVPQGLYRLPRDPGDEAQIVESWI